MVDRVAHYLLIFLLEVPVFPGFKELCPCNRAEDVHGRGLSDVDVLSCLLSQIKIGAFPSGVRHDLVIFAGFGEVVVSKVFDRVPLEFGCDVHFQELNLEMFARRPRENDGFGQQVIVLRHELHNRIPFLSEGVGYGDGYGLKAQTVEANLVAALHDHGEEASVIGIRTTASAGQENAGIGHRRKLSIHFREQHTGKLN